MKPQIERALGRYLAVRERSRAEISRYLVNKKVDPREIETLLNRWQEVGIVNDASFVATLVRSYLKKGKGTLFIRQKLQQAGIGTNETTQALAGIAPEELAEAMQWRLHKASPHWRPLGLRERRQKAFQVLAASGFLSADARRFIDDQWEEE